MATQILRTVDRWRFETPLALALAGAAGFAALAMPHEIFARLPVAGHFGTPGHVALALLLAIRLRRRRLCRDAAPREERADRR